MKFSIRNILLLIIFSFLCIHSAYFLYLGVHTFVIHVQEDFIRVLQAQGAIYFTNYIFESLINRFLLFALCVIGLCLLIKYGSLKAAIKNLFNASELTKEEFALKREEKRKEKKQRKIEKLNKKLNKIESDE